MDTPMLTGLETLLTGKTYLGDTLAWDLQWYLG